MLLRNDLPQYLTISVENSNQFIHFIKFLYAYRLSFSYNDSENSFCIPVEYETFSETEKLIIRILSWYERWNENENPNIELEYNSGFFLGKGHLDSKYMSYVEFFDNNQLNLYRVYFANDRLKVALYDGTMVTLFDRYRYLFDLHIENMEYSKMVDILFEKLSLCEKLELDFSDYAKEKLTTRLKELINENSTR